MAELDRHVTLIAAFTGAAADPVPLKLGPALASACDEGRRAWPALEIDDAAFCHFLGARVPIDELVAGGELLPAADLYLACACTLGVAGAADQLVHAYGAAVRAAVARVLEPADQPEAAQRHWESLLVAGEHRTPRIGQYRGRGPLVAFVRVAAVRLAISERRKSRPANADELEVLQLADDADDPELSYLKQVYMVEFRRSFATAFAALPAPQQLLLRLDIIDQLTIDQAAAVYGRSRTTTGRHLLEARQALARDTLADLQARLGLGASEIHSLARLIHSQIDLSMHRLLADRR